MFLLSLVNAWGEEEAFEYFDKLNENVLHYTSSGSGPVNDLKNKEVAIGLGMTSHAVQNINNGENFEILFFDEGSPYSLYAQAIIKGYEDNEAVVEVFEFLATTLTMEQCRLFYPEKIFTSVEGEIENYPRDIKYADMKNNGADYKAELIGKWKY
jgi:iron(III) transport system substrate-binding protein